MPDPIALIAPPNEVREMTWTLYRESVATAANDSDAFAAIAERPSRQPVLH
jgi:hypothetical protein